MTLVLTFHPTVDCVHEILRKAHRHVLKPKRLSRVLQSPPRVASRNAKSLKDCLVRSKLKPESDATTGNFNFSSKRSKICKILVPGKEFKSVVTKKSYKMNFRFDSNSSDVIYLMSCTVCGRQYTSITVTKFRERFNQDKSNVNLCSQGVCGLMQEKMIDFVHNGSTDAMHVQIIDHCDANDKESRESFWTETLQTMHPHGCSSS